MARGVTSSPCACRVLRVCARCGAVRARSRIGHLLVPEDAVNSPPACAYLRVGYKLPPPRMQVVRRLRVVRCAVPPNCRIAAKCLPREVRVLPRPPRVRAVHRARCRCRCRGLGPGDGVRVAPETDDVALPSPVESPVALHLPALPIPPKSGRPGSAASHGRGFCVVCRDATPRLHWHTFPIWKRT
jgi:hypothetical protein